MGDVKMEEEKIVKVEWYDAHLYPESVTVEEAKELNPIVCSNVGYLIYEDEKKCIIASCKGENDIFRDILIIPRGMVKSITHLKEPIGDDII